MDYSVLSYFIFFRFMTIKWMINTVFNYQHSQVVIQLLLYSIQINFLFGSLIFTNQLIIVIVLALNYPFFLFIIYLK